MARTSIEWAEFSWNPLRGTTGTWACVKVSPGCANCYAERMNQRTRGGPAYLPGQDTPRLDELTLHEPRRWTQARRVFVCSMSDLFWEAVPDEWIERIFAEMVRTPRHTFLVLTKRVARMGAWLYSWRVRLGLASVPPHIWVGTSIENQHMAEARVPELLAIPAAVRWLSCEPLLGGIDLRVWLSGCGHRCDVDEEAVHRVCLTHWHESERPRAAGIDWVVAGGESGGPAARALVEPCSHGLRVGDDLAGLDQISVRCRHCQGTGWRPKGYALEWVRSLRDQCALAAVPFLYKQWGGPTSKAGGRLLDGVVHHAFPDVGALQPALL